MIQIIKFRVFFADSLYDARLGKAKETRYKNNTK